jgi:CHAT domain-containing protein
VPLQQRVDAQTGAPGAHEGDAEAAYWKQAQRLSATLLGPVAARLAGKRILLVPDGALHYLPFAALPIPGREQPTPLVVEHEIVNLPSASVLAALRREVRERPPAAGSVAVLADPVFERDDPRMPLPVADGHGASAATAQAERFPRLLATRAESAAVLASAPVGSTLRAIGFDASRATAISAELARYRILHFATHSVFDDNDPGSSGIVLALFDEKGRPQDGLLRLQDLYGLNLPVEMVVLSACDTALGKELKGEGLVGVVRGFMYAGSKRVVASAWRVDDEATGELMALFYRAMLKEGRSPAAALREAQLALYRTHRWRAPFYWAAFVLQGEPN